jgi:hypothetical protein
VPQFAGFFGSDFAAGGPSCFDVKVVEVPDLLDSIAGSGPTFPDFRLRARDGRRAGPN